MKKHVFLLPILALFVTAAACQQPAVDVRGKALLQKQKLPLKAPLQTIAIGSCNRVDKDQTIWNAILQNQPDLWIWLGDNIYADTDDMEAMKAMYLQQKYHPEYQKFRSAVPVIGIWDDHDYGVNDGDKRYAWKKASQQLLLDFLDVPAKAPVRSQEGAYQSFTFGPKGRRVKIILLDGRYFRDELEPGPPGSGIRYMPNPQGDMLGEAQWAWLERELRQSDAQVHLIGCGIQFLPEEQVYEKWANFPQARTRLLKLLDAVQPQHTLLISGDRHIAELSKTTLPKSGKALYELTSSGLTHTWSLGGGGEPNRYRVGELVIARNFGILRIAWTPSGPAIATEIRGLDNVLFAKNTLSN